MESLSLQTLTEMAARQQFLTSKPSSTAAIVPCMLQVNVQTTHRYGIEMKNSNRFALVFIPFFSFFHFQKLVIVFYWRHRVYQYYWKIHFSIAFLSILSLFFILFIAKCSKLVALHPTIPPHLGNIWTHFLGMVAFLGVATYFLSRPSIEIQLQEKLVFGAFFFGAIICLGFSFAFHTLCCHSETVGKLFSK